MKNTAKQIENMKKQTIGVEIEMAGITRKAAIKVIAKYFNTEDTIEHQ
ncbi:amidoligase family protein, partial [Allobaculum mucilyticum]